MKISTIGITAAVAMLAGAGLSGCAHDRNNSQARSNSQTYGAVASYNQPMVYQHNGIWTDPPANRYYDPRSTEGSGRGPQ